jgi:hypothetical protein
MNFHWFLRVVFDIKESDLNFDVGYFLIDAQVRCVLRAINLRQKKNGAWDAPYACCF